MRRSRATKRKILPETKYNNPVVAKFINMIMLDGKKSIAEKIVYNSLDAVARKTGKDNPVEVFQKAVDNVKPRVEVKARRIGGATYQVPVEVSQERSFTLALRWIRDYSRSKKGKPMQERLAGEILDAYKKEGLSVKKKEDTHRMAEANKAFSHYRW